MSEFKRQHPVAAVEKVFTIVKQNLFTFAILIYFGSQDTESQFFIYGIGATVILTFFAGIAGYFRFTYRVIDNELQIRKGIFVRKQIFLTKDRIQVIDLTEGLLQRIFGLVKVEVKTAGGGTESATLSAVTLDEANSIKESLKAPDTKMDSNVEADGVVQEVQSAETLENEVWKLSGGDLIKAALTSGNIGLIASFIGLFGGQLDLFITEENIEYITKLLPGIDSDAVVVPLIIFVVLVIIISWIISFVGVLLRFSDFKIEKQKDELHISSGLIERKHSTVPFNRIQGLRFVEGIIRQPLGYGMLYVESAGFEQNQQQRSIVIAPFISRSELPSFLKTFINDLEETESSVKPPKKSLFRYLRRPNYILLPLIPILYFNIDLLWLLLLLIPLLTLLGWLRFKDASVEWSNNLVLVRSRNLARTSILFIKKRAQAFEYSTNPFQRRKDLSTIEFTIASGSGGKQIKVKDLSAEDVDRVRRESFNYY